MSHRAKTRKNVNAIGDDVFWCEGCGEHYCSVCTGIERCEECDTDWCPDCWLIDAEGEDGKCRECREDE